MRAVYRGAANGFPAAWAAGAIRPASRSARPGGATALAAHAVKLLTATTASNHHGVERRSKTCRTPDRRCGGFQARPACRRGVHHGVVEGGMPAAAACGGGGSLAAVVDLEGGPPYRLGQRRIGVRGGQRDQHLHGARVAGAAHLVQQHGQ